VRGEWRALHQFDWTIIAGDNVSATVVPGRYSLAFPMQQIGSVEYHCDVYKCASSDPPTRLDPADTSVQKVGEIQLEFPVPAESLPVRKNGEDQYRALEYVQFSEIEGNSINFRATFKGATVGEMAVDYDDAEPEKAADSLFVD